MASNEKAIYENELFRNANKNFQAAFHLNPLPIVIISIENGRLIEANSVFLKLTGLTKEQMPFIEKADLCHFLHESDYLHIIKQIASRRYFANHQAKIKVKGMTKTLLLSGAVMRWDNQPCVFLLANDVTELELHNSQKPSPDCYSPVGELTAGIAHEVRNAKTIVSGFLQVMRNNNKYEEDFEILDLMIEEIDRANLMITEFLSLSRNKKAILKPGDLNSCLEKLYPLLKLEASKRNIQIDMELNNVPSVMFNEAELQQLVLNLVLNGLDSMSTGNALYIRTSEDQNGIRLMVEDHGDGIPAEIVNKLGIPYFTTKEKGTGLGLAICHWIAERHDARISIDTGSHGTIFTVAFPYP